MANKATSTKETTKETTKEGPNKATIAAQITFNVNTVKHKLQDYYQSQGNKMPTFTTGHIVMASVLEKLYEIILQECVRTVGKDKSGVRRVNREHLQYSVLLHNGLKRYFLTQLDYFDENQLYKDQVPISSADMDTVMANVDKDLSFTPMAKNLACFFLLKVFLDLAHTGTNLLEFAKKASLDGRCVMTSVCVKFHDTIAQVLRTEVVRVMNNLGKKFESDDSDDAETETTNGAVKADSNVDNDDETETTTKQDSKKTNSKKANTSEKKADSKKVTTVTIEDEDDENLTSADGDDGDDAEEETIVVEVKKKSQKSATSGNNKKNTAKSSK